MMPILYTDKTIETKMFLLPNIQNNPRKLNRTIRLQEHEYANYYGEEIKDPIFMNDIENCLEKIKVPRSFTSKKIPHISKISNKIFKLEPVKTKKLFNSSKQKENVTIQKNLCKKKSGKFINLTKVDFPYSKPKVNNSFTKVLLLAKNRVKNININSKI